MLNIEGWKYNVVSQKFYYNCKEFELWSVLGEKKKYDQCEK